MKRVSWPLILAAVVLLAWGASDFYHYAVTGQAVLQYYEGAQLVRSLVNYSLVQGLIKVVLGLLVIVVPCFAGKKRA